MLSCEATQGKIHLCHRKVKMAISPWLSICYRLPLLAVSMSVDREDPSAPVHPVPGQKGHPHLSMYSRLFYQPPSSWWICKQNSATIQRPVIDDNVTVSLNVFIIQLASTHRVQVYRHHKLFNLVISHTETITDRNKTAVWNGYTTLFRQTLFRQTLFRQSTVGTLTSGGWLQLNRPAAVQIRKTPNQILKIRGSTIVSRGEGAPQTPPAYLPRPHSPRSPRCLDQCRAFDACDASTPSNFSQFLLFPHMPKRAKDVLGRPDCGLSE